MPIRRLKRHPRAAWGVGLMLLAAAALYAVHDRISTQVVMDSGVALSNWVNAHPMLAMPLFLTFATLGKVGPIPGGIVVMLTGGFLFGGIWGGVMASLGAGFCAAGITLLGRRFFADWLDDRFGSRIEGLRDGIGRDSFWLLLAIRLTPIVPAWFGNLVPIPLRISGLGVFAATALGVLPISLVVGHLGAGLGSLAHITRISVGDILTPSIYVPLVLLALFSLAPIIVRRRLFGQRG